MKSVYAILLAFLLLSTISCSSTQQAYLQNFELVMAQQQDASVSMQEVQDSKIDLLYVRLGEKSRVVMSLGAYEKGQYKWISADQVMIVTEKGKIVKTVGLDKELSYSSLPATDNFSLLNIDQFSQVIDTNDAFGLLSKSTVIRKKDESITVLDKTFSTTLVEEAVLFTGADNKELQWINRYWFDSKSGELLRTIQTPFPEFGSVELVFVSSAARLSNES